MKISTKNLNLAEVRYFNVEKNGLESTEPLSQVVLVNRGDTYISLFNCGDFAPIYKNEENCKTSVKCEDENAYDSVCLVCGEVQDGEAWLLGDINFTDVFDSQEVDVDDVANYVLGSELFFKDRIEIAKSVQKRYSLPAISVMKLIENDQKQMEKMNAFFAERERQKVNKK